MRRMGRTEDRLERKNRSEGRKGMIDQKGIEEEEGWIGKGRKRRKGGEVKEEERMGREEEKREGRKGRKEDRSDDGEGNIGRKRRRD